MLMQFSYVGSPRSVLTQPEAKEKSEAEFDTYVSF